MESHESQQTTVSVIEFNKIKNELQNLMHLMTVIMGKFDNQVPSSAAQNSRSPTDPPQEAPTSQHMSAPSIQINMPQLVLHLEPLQYEEEMSVGVDREIKDKVEELERQLKQIKGIDSLDSVNFNNLCIHPGLKFPTKF